MKKKTEKGTRQKGTAWHEGCRKGAGRGLISVDQCNCCWVKPRKRLMKICEGLGGKGERVVALGDGKGGEG